MSKPTLEERLALARKVKAVEDETGFERKALGRECKARGILSISGEPWNLKTAHFENWWTNNKKLVDQEAHEARDAQTDVTPVEPVSEGPKTTETGERKEQEAHAAHEAQETQIPWPDIEARMKAIAREVVQETMNAMNMKHVEREMEKEDFPPEPETLKGPGTKGRKENRKYKRFTISLDENLAKLFEDDMDRLNVGAGRMADIIFWRYYGKPELTYGQEASEDPTPDDQDE